MESFSFEKNYQLYYTHTQITTKKTHFRNLEPCKDFCCHFVNIRFFIDNYDNDFLF